MARAALAGRLSWQTGEVIDILEETPRTRSVVIDVPSWRGHLADQHVDIRLTAEDGYQAQRSYSIASSPEDGYLVLAVQRLPDGEVSTYLHDELHVADSLELRGPIGGYFVWDDARDGLTQLIAAGTGVVPFRAMLRHRSAVGSTAQVRLLYSAQSLEEVLYYDELMQFAAYDEVEIKLALTRAWPQAWRGHRGRVDRAVLGESLWPARERPLTLVCGPTGCVEAIAETLVTLGHPPEQIKTERFGPSG